MSRPDYNRMKFDQAYLNDSNREYSATLKALVLPEILQEIFKHFDIQDKGRAAQVSQLWRYTIEQPHVWNNVTAHLHYIDKDPYQYEITDKIRFWDTPRSMQAYWRPFPFIGKLVVYGPTNKATSLLVQRFRNLTSLELMLKCSDVTLALICGGLKSLRRLDLKHCQSVTDVSLAILCGWNGVGSEGDTLTLHSLCLLGSINLTNEALKFISVGQPALQTLDLSGCERITNSGLQFLTRLANLRVLNVTRCGRISDDGVVHLTQMANLKDLNVGSRLITRTGLMLLGSSKLRLTRLVVRGCKMGDDKCGQPLARMMLNNLELCGTNIGDAGLQCLADDPGASTIDTIFLRRCYSLTDEAGRHLARMRNLRVVYLDHSPLGDIGLGHLTNAVDSRIEVLSIRINDRITDASLSHVLSLPRLRKVIVCNCDLFVRWAQIDSRITVSHIPFDCHKCMMSDLLRKNIIYCR